MAHDLHVQQDFRMPVSALFAHLSEHENLEALFGAKVTRLRDGDDGTRNGVGSARSLKLPGLPAFEETNTEVVPDSRIVYRITKGSPLRNHEGVMAFSSRPDGGSHLDYRIHLDSKIPGTAAIVHAALKRTVTKALRDLDARGVQPTPA